MKKGGKKRRKNTENKIKKNWKVLLFCLLAVYAVAFLGSLFTSNAVNSNWYSSVKNSLTPPNWVFPIVWNILFLLIAFSLFYAWISGKKGERKKIAIVFAANLFLNALWSVLFFFFKNPNLAFLELILFWISIIAMIFITRKIEKKSAWLLVPYLLWVSFAGILNYLIAFG
jgi:translocator protein